MICRCVSTSNLMCFRDITLFYTCSILMLFHILSIYTTSSILIHHDFYSIHLLFNTLYNIYSSKIIVKILY